MNSAESVAADAKRHAQQASQEAIPWVVWLARIGYAAKGLVYILIGALAVQVALGTGGQTTGPGGALETLNEQPFGQVLLAIVAVGLFGYALWRLVQSFVDPDHAGSDLKGIVKRIGYAVSGIVYGAIGYEAVRILMGAGGRGDGDMQAQHWTARLMQQPYGPWLVGIVGVILVGTGLYQFYRSYSGKFKEYMKLHEMSSEEITWATRSGKIGFAARGVVYVMLGGFLIQAAIQNDPTEAGGLAQTLEELARQPYGPWLMGIVAAGLVAYGFFAIVQARYRRIFIPN